MLPEPPKPPKPARPVPARRGTDAAGAVPKPTLAKTKMRPLAVGAKAAPFVSPHSGAQDGLDRPANAVLRGVAMWAASAFVAACVAWVLTAGGGLSPLWSAPVATVLALACGSALRLIFPQPLARGQLADDSLAALSSHPGVASRALFLDLAERERARARRYGTGAALLLVDVDRCTRLVESHGAAAADAVLSQLARLTAPTLRGADAIARFGPSQLAVFLAQADVLGSLDVAERIRERAETMEVPFTLQPLKVTVSLGVAQLRPAHLNLQALIHDAEDAVFASRQAGGNCVRAAPVDLGPQAAPGSPRDDHRARPP